MSVNWIKNQQLITPLVLLFSSLMAQAEVTPANFAPPVVAPISPVMGSVTLSKYIEAQKSAVAIEIQKMNMVGNAMNAPMPYPTVQGVPGGPAGGAGLSLNDLKPSTSLKTPISVGNKDKVKNAPVAPAPATATGDSESEPKVVGLMSSGGTKKMAEVTYKNRVYLLEKGVGISNSGWVVLDVVNNEVTLSKQVLVPPAEPTKKSKGKSIQVDSEPVYNQVKRVFRFPSFDKKA